MVKKSPTPARVSTGRIMARGPHEKILNLEPPKPAPAPPKAVTNRELQKELGEVVQKLDDHVTITESNFQSVNSDLATIKHAIGLAPNATKPVGMMSTWQFAWRNIVVLGSSLSGVILLFKVSFAVFPAAEHFLIQLFTIMLHV